MTITNHLKGETSPYLLQHILNPVDWYPWGKEALDKARRENKPLLVSIGYSACHWCHVMERESFKDREVAHLMNQHFVCIKVDREERPDIDHLYMNAVQMVSGHGGWPLNCFALPDGRPFWGGTYFPKQQWMGILERVSELYRQQYEDVLKQADNLTKGVSTAHFVEAGRENPAFGRPDVQNMFDNLMEYMDRKQGGTTGAPKFPLPGNQAFLLHYHNQTKNHHALEQFRLTLKKMAMGGIYDQIGGGFARYATDVHWKVPHFEKMLYDNGQLISLYSDACKQTGDPFYKEVVYESIAFAERELTSPEGLFYSALDADSEGEEGKFYVWTGKEVDALLGDDAPLIKEYYRLGKEGLWEQGKNILLRTEEDAEFAHRMGMDRDLWKKVLDRSKSKLLQARDGRVRPGLDNKVLISWNALMIAGLSDAYAAFRDERFLKSATNAAGFILTHAMDKDGRLYRTLWGKKPVIAGFLEDYALFSMALVSLYQVSGRLPYLKAARKLAEYVLKHFSTPGTHLFAFSATDAEQLAAPHYELHDNVIPASNSVMARVLFYLAHYFEEARWGDRSSKMLGDMRERLDKYSSSFTNWGILLMHHTGPFHTVVITGPEAASRAAELNAMYLPDVLIAWADTEKNARGLPVFSKRFVPGKTMIYVCSMGHCKLPVETVEEALAQLG